MWIAWRRQEADPWPERGGGFIKCVDNHCAGTGVLGDLHGPNHGVRQQGNTDDFAVPTTIDCKLTE